MDIVEEIQNDPEKGAKRLESEYRAGLMTLALRFCHDPGDAAELVNRTFAEVVASIDNYAEQSAFFGWMSKILVNLHAKDVRRKSNGEIVYPGEVPETADESAHEDIFRNVDASHLRDAIETLPNDIRQTLMMHYFMDLSVAQVAKILSVPGGTVKWRLHYARQILATKLGAAAKNPKGKALLVALALAALTAVGATVSVLVGDAAFGNRPQPAAESGRELSASGSRLQSAAESDLDPSATGCRLLSAPDTSTSPMTGDTMNTTKTARTLAAASLAVATSIASAETQPTPSASLYVQNGLVACWDGVENAGTGVHDASATVWKDLVAGREFTLTGVTVNDNRMTFAGAKTSYGSLNATDTADVFLPATNGTVEVVYASTLSGNGVQTVLQSSTDSGIVMTLQNQNLFYACNASAPRYSISYGLATNTTAVHYTNAKPAAAFQNCGALATSTTSSMAGSKTTTTIGHTSNDNYFFTGHIFCIRVYNRHLTADELASNRELDLDRFVRGASGAIVSRKVRIANFDEDLATVYVNGEPAPSGAIFTVADGNTFTVDIRDFQSDWYFAFAPPSQTDRTLALDYWGGLPPGTVSNTATCTFTPREYLTTVTPNIDCKGHVWHAEDDGTSMSNTVYKLGVYSFRPATRSVTPDAFKAYYAGDRVMDFAMRVRKDGVNYTVTTIQTTNGDPFKGAAVQTIRFAPRLSSVNNFTYNVTTSLQSIIGLDASAITAVPDHMMYYSMSVAGAISNYVPVHVATIGRLAYNNRRTLTGVLPLHEIQSLGNSAFYGCSGITELYSTSPLLTTIGDTAFANASDLKKVTLASPVLETVSPSAFSTALTNLTYLSSPPASQEPLDAIVTAVPAADGAHPLSVCVPLSTPGWWDWVSEPTAAEVAAGLPEGCYGVYMTGTGDRKGWMIATDDVDSSLVVTDMSQGGNTGYEIHADLMQGDTLTLSREGFTACDLQHFNRATGAWETFETKQGDSFTYTHDGRLTRARWKINGFALNLSSDCYGGTFAVSGATPIVGDNIYAPGAVLTVTAAGRAEHPTSHFTAWTSGGLGTVTNSAAITLTMDADKTLAAAFAPDEWLYDATAKTITDGEYTSTGTTTLDSTAKSVAVPNFTGGKSYALWLDLSLPVHVPADPAGEYAITSLGISANATFRKVRFGERFATFTGSSPFGASRVIERLDNLGHTRLTAFPAGFTHAEAQYAPLHTTTRYEANDFLPETLVTIGNYWYTGGPYLVGTLRLPNFTTIATHANYANAFSGRTAGVTNLYLTCEALTTLNPAFFHAMKLQELTIGSTNLTDAASGSFSGAAATLERMNFLAHAPATAALDNILVSYSARTTTSAKPLEIRCSKYAPGWRELAAAVDRSSDEWRARPAGTWGIYQTTAGKRFYLVQRDSKYDKNPFTLIIMR